MEKRHFETIAIRTQMEKTAQKEHSTPLYLTSSFTFDTAEEGAGLFSGDIDGNLYSRFSNPNTDEFVEKLRLLEQCDAGVATASGMAAVYISMVALLKQGDHIVASSAIFGNSRHVISSILPGMGVTHTYVDVDQNSQWEAAIQSNTKMLFVESPSNPTLKTTDLTFLGDLCKSKDLIFSVDNCFATPYLQQPSKFGADLVIHSATKYIDGQGRVLGGAIIGKERQVKKCYDFIRRMGASLSPFNAWVLSKSIETLALRMDRHCSNAVKVASFLNDHSEVEKVIYPHHKDYAQYDLAKKQMSQGGGLVGCQIKGGAKRGAAFLNVLNLHSLTANLGDARSIATHPASTTHSKMSNEERLAVDITPGFIRFSVGLEHVDDIIKDIDQALYLSKK
jgi:O-succinylhomoserine sulfhydrylase